VLNYVYPAFYLISGYKASAELSGSDNLVEFSGPLISSEIVPI